MFEASASHALQESVFIADLKSSFESFKIDILDEKISNSYAFYRFL